MLAKPTGGAARIIPALDTGDLARAEALAAALAGRCGVLKVGLELFCAAGGPAVAAIARHAPVFLDVKLHDIPNTVAGALRSLLPLRPAMVTLHAGGGPAMIAAARAEAEKAGADRPILLAVTVLTSMDAAALAATGVADTPAEQVRRLARMAVAAGADGLVCSPQEAALLRADLGPGPALVVPGVRPAGSDAGDQARVATPAEAVAAGADWIVVGRPITGAPDPAVAAAAIAASIPG
ncbi:orotidine-5'-phosphate decarboxylase [Neoroseomonas oryzicola]|uniref:Orotidine 5'-phosphate decarboxylase n=1 Tax=Neoroseomonas oryzicola TaxID=535904 RepID=A0A9X9WEH1_9PROT|nr:orotidine-5'-phosphate decarboxylase [Neoroseomonas oryzicola]MBR0658731.1 orotidine-5'-phosphate decarboxylase [Neoroseomonas oryzicola]NKE17833.1 orotidine-5'-phosphate decarboxylase [Neoroseomonas oryzicola]